jgi:hypothetical protein
MRRACRRISWPWDVPLVSVRRSTGRELRRLAWLRPVWPSSKAQLCNAACRVFRQRAEDIGEPGARIDVVQLAGFNQCINGNNALAAAVGAGEGPVVPTNAAQARSTALLDRQIRPSLRKRVIATQRLRLYWMALATGFFEESPARSAPSLERARS